MEINCIHQFTHDIHGSWKRFRNECVQTLWNGSAFSGQNRGIITKRSGNGPTSTEVNGIVLQTV